MAKKIKFNLIVDDKAVRSINDLKRNFNLQDILEVYKNGLLERWLEVREYDEYLNKIKGIDLSDDIKLAKELVEIFAIGKSKKEVKKSVYALEFLEEKEKRLALVEEKENKWEKIIAAYHKNYKELKKSLINRKSEMPYIKNSIKEIHEQYLELFKLNYYDFYFQFIEEKALFPILAILMNKNLKNIFLEDEEIKTIIFDDIMKNIEFGINNEYEAESYFGAEIKFIEGKSDSEKITDQKVYVTNAIMRDGNLEVINKKDENNYKGKEIEGKVLNGLTLNSEGRDNYFEYIELNDMFADIDSIKENIKIFSGETDDYWTDIEPKGKKCMIISMEAGNYVRNLGKNGEELSNEDINGKFLILDGIDYKSNNEKDKLIYMEV